jgi:hypothetical protein
MAITTILSAVAGFAGSVLPSVVDVFRQKEANKQKLKLLEMQGELAKQNVELDLMAYNEKAIDKEHERLIQHDTSLSQEKGFWGGLRKSVRPIITYMFFALFASVKIVTMWSVMVNGGSFLEAADVVWDNETEAIFAAIVAFWFGSRTIEKRYNRIS